MEGIDFRLTITYYLKKDLRMMINDLWCSVALFTLYTLSTLFPQMEPTKEQNIFFLTTRKCKEIGNLEWV